MKRPVIIGIIVAVIAIGGVIAWMVLGSNSQNTDSTRVGDAPAASDVTDKTDATVVTVNMKNTAFTPQKIKIKKGTTVKWVNEDDIRHNVVAADENDERALPTQASLFGKGGTYQFTFTTVGTFDYKCTPHPFMTGSVEVVE